ncbi:MAG: bifunctional metallophosphatase/5'-nucleotidase [Bacteroidetes bacterium]|nr:MAG: bifunctional metallophosphatase/5'-nucleotidase [Bacteroidota bacterium]
MKRRDFIKKNTLVAGGLLVAPSVPLLAKKSTSITILHTNDTHSQIDPFPANHSKYPNRGGVAARYALIEKIRSEEENVLLLDAGDIFQGTPYFNVYKGVLEMKLMTKMKYDVATLGNHDFDIGLDGFMQAADFAEFPFVSANYDFSETCLNGKIKRSVIIEKGGLKIGILGIGVELEGLVPASKYGDTKYLDPVESANAEALSLKKQGCDLIICLSHLGYSYETEKISDLKLAAKSEHIHLIIGGHTHTFLDEPTQVKNKKGETVLVNQVGYAGINIGRIDFDIIERKLKCKDHIEVK